MKLETYLRMAGISYEISEFTQPNIAPKGKGPFITDENGKLGDSSIIIEYLAEKHGINMDADLNDKEKSLAHSYKIMAEERLYWIIVYSRWTDDNNWPKLKRLFFNDIPWPINLIIPKMVRKSVIKDLNVIGISRHSKDEIYAFARRDIDAIAAQLGNNDYFLGDKPHIIDATILAIIANLLIEDFKSPLLEEVKRHDNLIAYHKRMMKRFYS